MVRDLGAQVLHQATAVELVAEGAIDHLRGSGMRARVRVGGEGENEGEGKSKR